MIRFAVTVTIVELVLTVIASLWIATADSVEPFLGEDELRRLEIDVQNYSTERRLRFGALFSYETRAQMKGGGPSIVVSVRVNTPRGEYEGRLTGERYPKLKEGEEAPVVTDENWPEEPGYAVRQCGRNGARAEVVRLHGGTMLVVRAVQLSVEGNVARANAARCERIARMIQEHMAGKLGWRDPP